MRLPEHCEQFSVGDLLRIEDDEHGLGVPCSSAANLLIGRVRCEASSVADCCGVNAVDLPEFTLGPPEAAETKDRSARTLGKGWLEGCAEHGVLLGNGESRLLPAGKSLGGHDHLGLVATKQHAYLLGCINVLDPGARRNLLQSEADYGLAYCTRARLRPLLA